MTSTPLKPDSEFSRAVFKLIRPHIPRERWPVDSVRGRFEPAGDGLWLKADFDDFSKDYAELAALLVREARVDLVLKSPVAAAAAAVVRAKRWRDFALYAFLPLMFAIPLMAPLSDAAMRLATGLFGLDLVLLVGWQISLSRKRSRMAQERFIANIPAPGLKISLGGSSGSLPFGEEMPDV
ncbi:MAG: hypothetical protein NVV74_20000 [Magnetospirillum sp.]|nr:hypothetical protein [Magnetospirillum sp.]